VGPYLLSDVQVFKPKTLAVPRETLLTHYSLDASGNFEFQKGELLMSESNKNVVRRLFEEVWNKGNLQVTDELFTPNYAHHDASTPDVGRGPDSEKKRATLYRTAFPDIRLTIEDLIAEGETVIARWSCRGTHKGDLSGIPPTGKQVNITGVSIARFANGKMSEGWVNWDALALMQQLGVVPELGKAKTAAR
jgi:steroid delta-isomerase-like uncharacterized protein